MKNDLIELYRVSQQVHERSVQVGLMLEQALKQETSTDELADIAYALRETSRLMDDVRKRCDKLQKIAEKTGCFIAVTTGDMESKKTEHCTYSPDVRTIVSIPRQSSNPEGFAALMDYLKIPRELWNSENGHRSAVEFHWPGLVELLSKHQAAGKPLPPGIDPNKTYADYRLNIRARKGVSA